MSLALLILGPALLLMASFLLWRVPVALAAVVVGAAAITDLTGLGKEGFQFGVTIYPTDLACAALVGAAIVVSLRTRSLPQKLCWPVLILLGLAVLNFARGVVIFGIKAPGNGARDLVNLALPAVAVSVMCSDKRVNVDRLTTCLSFASLALAALAAARWTGIMALPAEMSEDFREVPRALSSDAAIVIGQTLIAVLGLQWTRGIRMKGVIFAVVLAGLVFALQHRSVWLATIAGIVWLAVRSPRLEKTEWLKLSSIALLAGFIVTFLPLVSPRVFDGAARVVHANVEEIGQEDSTWSWRVQGYSEAIERVLSESPVAAVLGPPSGRDLSDRASFASIHIHDRYVSMLAYYGVTGLIFLTAWLITLASRIGAMAPAGSRDRIARSERVTLEAILVSALVFFVPYSGGQLEGSLLGLIWLAALNGQSVRATRQWSTQDSTRLRTVGEAVSAA